MSLYPTTFRPIFKERVWGGRTLEQIYGKTLPPGASIGESWEIADRPGDESIVANGPLAGRSLRWLMEQHRAELLGRSAAAAGDRFPLLCKILDARQTLSLQVHPPARVAHLGDPKTEMWYIAAAEPGAELLVGLRHGVTRDTFEHALAAGRVADCFHRIPVRAGDAMFLPSGRVHAIGAGLVIFEIQQNSDTTFRVYDWDRLGLDGKPRDLHVSESLASIDFDDVEPALAGGATTASTGWSRRELVRHQLFNVDRLDTTGQTVLPLARGTLRVIAATAGALRVTGGEVGTELQAGQWAVVPAGIDARVEADAGAQLLMVEAGDA